MSRSHSEWQEQNRALKCTVFSIRRSINVSTKKRYVTFSKLKFLEICTTCHKIKKTCILPHEVFMCFACFLQKVTIATLNTVFQMVFIMITKSVLCEARNRYVVFMCIIIWSSVLKGLICVCYDIYFWLNGAITSKTDLTPPLCRQYVNIWNSLVFPSCNCLKVQVGRSSATRAACSSFQISYTFHVSHVPFNTCLREYTLITLQSKEQNPFNL